MILAGLRRLRREELPVATEALARYLIGKVLVHEISGASLIGRIVETKAYPPGDPAGHMFTGPTRRNCSFMLWAIYSLVARSDSESKYLSKSGDSDP